MKKLLLSIALVLAGCCEHPIQNCVVMGRAVQVGDRCYILGHRYENSLWCRDCCALVGLYQEMDPVTQLRLDAKSRRGVK